jgi:hypothetical protein
MLGFRRVLCSSIIPVLSILCASQPASATENGGTVWPVGAESFATSAAVPAAHKAMFYEYTLYYFANQVVDASGHNVAPADFKLRVFAVAGKVAYNWGLKTPLGELGSYVASPFVYESVEAGGTSNSRFDASNQNIVPIELYNHKGMAYWTYEFQYESKAGGYDATKAVNVGEHNDALTPSFAFTLVPHRDSQNITSRFDYEFNNPDHATHYHSGNEFFWQYGAQQEIPGRKMTVGLEGYFYKQITNDTLKGVPVVTENADGTTSTGYKGRAWDLGPQATFPLGKHGAMVVKWSHDMLVQNKPHGNGLWFQFGLPLRFGRE